MYDRVAIQVDQSPYRQWKSTVLSSLNTLLQFLRLYRALPQDHVWVFSSSSQEGLKQQFVPENKGLGPNLVTAAQFLQERMLYSLQETGGNARTSGTRSAGEPGEGIHRYQHQRTGEREQQGSWCSI